MMMALDNTSDGTGANWDSITKALLETEGISGVDGWKQHEELKKQLIEFARSVLSKSGISWINIVALAIPKRPDILSISLNQDAWHETVKDALFLPILIDTDTVNQERLEKIYSDINKDVNKDLHLSAIIAKDKYLGDYIYRFVLNNKEQNNQIKIESYKHFMSNEEDTFTDAYSVSVQYNELFKITNNNYIWFVPHRMLHRQAAQTKLYEIELSGVYLSFKYSRDDSNGEKVDDNLNDILMRFAKLFYVVRRRDQDNILADSLKEIWDQNEKKLHMLDLLMKPLDTLTDVIRNAEKSVHELRAILYEPVEGIFAKYTDIEELFKKGRITNPDKSITVVLHTPKEYSENYNDACWILAHAISRIMSFKLEGNDAQNALKSTGIRLIAAAGKSTDPFHQMAVALLKLLGLNACDANAENLCKDDNAIGFLDNIKKYLFTSFKPDAANEKIDWDMISMFLPIKIDCKAFFNNDSLDIKKFNTVLLKNCNPFLRQSILLGLIAGIVTQAANQNNTDDICAEINAQGKSGKQEGIPTYNPNKISFTLKRKSTSLIKFLEKDEEIEKLTNRIKAECSAVKEGLSAVGVYGDFYRPFVIAIRLCTRDMLPTVDKTNNEIKLLWTFAESEMSLNISSKEFKIESKGKCG